MLAVELLLRVLAETRSGRRPADEAVRIAGRCAVVPHPIAAADLDQLQRLGTDVFGPSFSAADLVADRPVVRRGGASR